MLCKDHDDTKEWAINWHIPHSATYNTSYPKQVLSVTWLQWAEVNWLVGSHTATSTFPLLYEWLNCIFQFYSETLKVQWELGVKLLLKSSGYRTAQKPSMREIYAFKEDYVICID